MQQRVFTILGLLTLAATPALADPRDDTLAGISRCAHLPDNRVFLDCIYGAAQPMRAALGLPPAPAAQIQLVPPPPDRAAPFYAAPPMIGPAPVAPAPENRMAAKKSDNWLGSIFGSDSSASLRMASYTFDKRGLFTVTLTDGEVWRQMQNDTNFADWRSKPADYVVRVLDTSSGSKMDVRGESGPYSVERVR